MKPQLVLQQPSPSLRPRAAGRRFTHKRPPHEAWLGKRRSLACALATPPLLPTQGTEAEAETAAASQRNSIARAPPADTRAGT